MFIDLLEEFNILPAVAYVGSNGKSEKEKEIIPYLVRKGLKLSTTFNQNDLDIILLYPPYGRDNYSDFEYLSRAETTQRLIEDIIIKSYLPKDLVTGIIKYSSYLENIYGTYNPTKDTTKFKEAIDDMGGINTFDLTRMEESFKLYKGYEYCLPVWALE